MKRSHILVLILSLSLLLTMVYIISRDQNTYHADPTSQTAQATQAPQAPPEGSQENDPLLFSKIAGTNVLNLETVEVGKCLNYLNGKIFDKTTSSVTEYIKVSEGDRIEFYNNGSRCDVGVVLAYTTNHESGVIPNSGRRTVYSYTVPEGASYIRVAFTTSRFTDSPMFKHIVRSLPTDNTQEYTEYDSLDIKIPKDSVIGLGDDLNRINLLSLTSKFIPSMCDDYHTATEYIAPPERTDLNTVYSLYDELMEAYPDYITKALVGNVTVDGTELPIYRYDFKPPVPAGSKMEDLCKCILTTGTHGTEGTPIAVGYRLMKDICENWRTSKLLETLRFNVHFTVIPVVNPYGFLNETRKNENGIDINRNFKTDFAAGTDQAATDYAGMTANSEQSTQLITTLCETETFDFGIDFHTFGSYTAKNASGYFVNCMKRPQDTMFSRVFALWANAKTVKENEAITDLNTSHFQSLDQPTFEGYLYSAFPNGVLFEALGNWGDPSLGTNESAQKLAVELLGSAVLTLALNHTDTTNLW